MEARMSAQDLVARLEPEVDRIDGLITVTASGEKVSALTTSRDKLPRVREELLGLGVPDHVLDVLVIGDAAIPYPVTDERLRQWLDEADEIGDVAAEVSVRGPEVKLTARGVGKVVLILFIGFLLVTPVVFILLMLFDWLIG